VEGAEIPDDLFGDWKRAVVRHLDEGEEHVLERVFPKYPDVAFEWIEWRLEGIREGTSAFYFGLRYDRVVSTAVGGLTKEQRKALIDKMPRASAVTQLVRSLVGCDMDMFLHLLSRDELEDLRLDPLNLATDGSHPQGVIPEFGENWRRMAIAAMEKGFSEADIFSATQGGTFTWSGPRSSMYEAKLAPFEKLLLHSDARLRRVGQMGFEHFSQLRDESLSREKRADVRGFP
jgi:hypothetical protein